MLVLALHATLVSSPLLVNRAYAQDEDEDFGEGDPSSARKK